MIHETCIFPRPSSSELSGLIRMKWDWIWKRSMHGCRHLLSDHKCRLFTSGNTVWPAFWAHISLLQNSVEMKLNQVSYLVVPGQCGQHWAEDPKKASKDLHRDVWRVSEAVEWVPPVQKITEVVGGLIAWCILFPLNNNSRVADSHSQSQGIIIPFVWAPWVSSTLTVVFSGIS